MREFKLVKRLPDTANPFAGDWHDSVNELEIGAGVGRFAVQRALRNPSIRLFSLEHTKERFAKFWRRYENNGSPENLIPLHANALSWVPQFIPDASISKIWLLFPNLNKGHVSKRWAIMPFMGELLKKLKRGGSVELATNEEFYFTEFNYYISKQWGLISEGQILLHRLRNLDYVCRTHFEKKYFESGQEIYQGIWFKS